MDFSKKGPEATADSPVAQKVRREQVMEKARLSGDLILGSSANEAKGLTDRARDIFNGSMPLGVANTCGGLAHNVVGRAGEVAYATHNGVGGALSYSRFKYP